MNTLLARARNKARHWNRVFSRFLGLLDGLSQREGCLLTGSLLFLMQRAVGNLEFEDADGGIRPVEPIDEALDSTFEGLDFEAAIEGALQPRSEGHDICTDELQVLMVLANGLLKDVDTQRFVDPSFDWRDVAAEYMRLGSVTGNIPVERCSLLPVGVKEAWARVLQHAGQQRDALRRLRLEMTVMRVIRALYAMAIGVRRAAIPTPDEEGRWAWIAFTTGDSSLGAMPVGSKEKPTPA